MDELAYESLSKYFNRLSKTGYVPYTDVKKLLVLVFIKRLLDTDSYAYLEEEDFHNISQALECLMGTSCLINYPINYGETSFGIYHRTCGQDMQV